MDTSKSLFPLWEAVVTALAVTSEGNVLFNSRDLSTLRERAENEGIPLFTRTLPALGADVYESFRTGKLVVRSRFHPRSKHDIRPAFLNDCFAMVYHSDGTLRDITSESSYAVHCLLTVTTVFKKLSGDYNLDGLLAQVDRFRELQLSLPTMETVRTFSNATKVVLTKAKALLEQVLSGTQPWVITPFHGNGGTADRVENRRKWSFEYSLPSFELYAKKYSPSPYDRQRESIQVDDFARIVFVPKNWDAPRMIAMEQTVRQEHQQGLKDILYYHIECTDNPARGFVNFTDQGFNQSTVAATENATLDLSRASDTVSCAIVNCLFPPEWVEALFSTRSTYALYEHPVDIPNREPGDRKILIPLRTFAPMGAATSFPVEALVFWSLVESLRRLHGVDGHVLVYGDDIICHSSLVQWVEPLFQELGFELNLKKSFWTGPFRESCGFDRFGEREVTVPKVHHCRFTEAIRSQKIGLGALALAHHGFLTEFYRLFGFERGWHLHRSLERLERINFPLTSRPHLVPLGIKCTDMSLIRYWTYVHNGSMETGVLYDAPVSRAYSQADVITVLIYLCLKQSTLSLRTFVAVYRAIESNKLDDKPRYEIWSRTQCKPSSRFYERTYSGSAESLPVVVGPLKRAQLLPGFSDDGLDIGHKRPEPSVSVFSRVSYTQRRYRPF